MKHIFLFGTLILLYSACSTQANKAGSNDSLKTDIISKAAVVENDLANSKMVKPKTFEGINKSLYDNLVNGEFGPFAVENDSGYYVLGMESYIEGLEATQIFGEEFYEHEMKRLKVCKDDLDKLKHTGDTDLGWAPNSCPFDYMYWLRSQEHPTGYEIQNLIISDSTAHSTMVFYEDYEGKRSYWDLSYLKIRYEKQNGEWRIVEIKRLPID